MTSKLHKYVINPKIELFLGFASYIIKWNFFKNVKQIFLS